MPLGVAGAYLTAINVRINFLLCGSPTNPIDYFDDGTPSDNSVTDFLLNCSQTYFKEIATAEAFLTIAYSLPIFII